MKNPFKKTVVRSAETGQFVNTEEATKNPDTTVTETVNPSCDTEKTDELQNGGTGNFEARISALETQLANVIKRNHLLTCDR